MWEKGHKKVYVSCERCGFAPHLPSHGVEIQSTFFDVCGTREKGEETNIEKGLPTEGD